MEFKPYKDKLNSDSKILYAFLLDRLSLSQKNHWIDQERNIYLIFTREEVQEKRQGLGKPNLIYGGKIQHEETENLRGINTNNIKTNIINTDSINPNSDDEFYLKEIKDKCKLEDFSQEEKTILEDVINSLYYKDI